MSKETTWATATAGDANDTADGAFASAVLHPDRSRHWLVRVFPIVRRQRGLALLVLVFSIGAVFFQTALPSLLGRSIDALGRSVEAGHPAALHQALILLIGAGLIRSLMNFSVRFTLFKLTFAVDACLRRLVYNHLCCVNLAFHSRYRIGQLISRANTDIRTLQNFLLYLPYTVMVFCTFALSIIYMFSVDVRLALLAIASLPGVFVLSLRLRRLVYPLSWLVQSRSAEVATVVDENLRGQAAVKLFTKEVQQMQLLRGAALRLRWATNEMIRYRARYTPWIENIAVLSQIAILVYGGWLVIANQILLGQLVAFNVYVIMMLIPFRTLGQVLVMGRNAAAASVRVLEILDEPLQTTTAEARGSIPAVTRSMVFERVNYVAPPDPAQPGGSGRQVLSDLDTTIAAGVITAIVGKTGSGKSAMANLLAGLARPTTGRILLDGAAAEAMDPSAVRRQIVLVPQESFLFAASIADNIRFGAPGASQEAIEQAARLAGAHDFILAQPNGYDTPVGEGGTTLSGGQRQRIAIAMALLLAPSVLILDDATSALDTITEKQILDALRQDLRGRTIVIISHRASLVQHADEVQLLHQGRIVDRGSHAQLLERQPLYHDVFVQPEGDPVASQTAEESDAEFRQRISNSVRGAASVDVSVGEAI